MINPIAPSPVHLVFAFAIGATVEFVVAELGYRILRSPQMPAAEARAISLFASTVGCIIGVYLIKEEKDAQILVALLVGIAAAAFFLMQHRRPASDQN